MGIDKEHLTPKKIVGELDKYIIRQEKAKKAVAIALRNRIRRQHLPENLRDEVAPKNIIMIGPTGVGKTEIARRLAKLVRAPFLKVEATKYTEVGYVGRDVESMVRDLMQIGVAMVKSEQQEGVKEKAEKKVEERLLDLLVPQPVSAPVVPVAKKDPQTNQIIFNGEQEQIGSSQTTPNVDLSATREKFRKMLQDGLLEDRLVEMNVKSQTPFPSIEIFSGSSIDEMNFQMGPLSDFFGGGRKRKKQLTIKNARQIILSEELDKLVDNESVAELARQRVEQMGIIFIDEIDKIAVKEGRSGGDVSREGVQRDILPIVEGSRVNTRFGVVDTSHILFIAAGAFHMSKPSDLIPELQGRFPIRVELDDLDANDFYQILTQPENALIKQYRELLKTEGVNLEFSDDAIKHLSSLAVKVNDSTDNIGARRLHTVMELLLEDLSFNAPDLGGQTITITPAYVDEKLKDIIQNQDLSRYIL